MDDARTPVSLTEAKAAQLLERAAKLDAERGGRVSIDELREIALEVGISSESFERALAEIRASGAEDTAPGTALVAPAQGPAPKTRARGSVVRALLDRAGLFLTGVGMAFGAEILMSGFGIDDEPVIIFTLSMAALTVIWSAVTNRRDRRVLDFELDLGVLWFAMTFFFMLINPSDAGAVLEVMMPAGLLASLVGGLVVATGPVERHPEELPERV